MRITQQSPKFYFLIWALLTFLQREEISFLALHFLVKHLKTGYITNWGPSKLIKVPLLNWAIGASIIDTRSKVPKHFLLFRVKNVAIESIDYRIATPLQAILNHA